MGRPAVPLSDQTFRRKVEEWIPMGRPQTTEDMAGPSPPPPKWAVAPMLGTPGSRREYPSPPRDFEIPQTEFSDGNEA